MPIPLTVQVTGGIAPSETTDTYPTHFSQYGKGGKHEVADTTELNAIPDERRVAYMIASVQSDGSYWELLPGPWTGTIADWNQLALGAAGSLGGDVTGSLGSNTVERIQGRAVDSGAPNPGDSLIWSADANSWMPNKDTQYFTSSANAVAVAPFIRGSYIIIYPGSPTSEAGTYQVTLNDGTTWPTDYTKVSDATDTAAEVGVVDSLGLLDSATDVEAALERLARGRAGYLRVSLTDTVAVQVDAVPVPTTARVVWSVVLENTVTRDREQWTVAASHNGDGSNDATTTDWNVGGPGPDSGHGIAVALFGVGPAQVLQLLVTAAGTNWRAAYRRVEALPT